ncbi:MAG: TIGR03013 family XrtA/PEP-CTERM system glycosyltransferase [Bradymonadia bacterium]
MSRRFSLLVALVETLLFFAMFLVSTWMWTLLDANLEISWYLAPMKGVLLAMIFQASLFYSDLYDFRSVIPPRALLSRLIAALVLAVLIGGLAYIIFTELGDRRVFAAALGLSAIIFVIWRTILSRYIGAQARTRVLIMGTGSLAAELSTMIKEREPLGYRLVGLLRGQKDDRRRREGDTQPPEVSGEIEAVEPDVVGTSDQLKEICRSSQADMVVVAMNDRRGNLPVSDLLDLKFQGVEIVEGVALYERFAEKIYLTDLKPSWMIFSDGFRRSDLRKVSKRLLDISASLFGLIVAGIPMAITALLVKITSPGPAIYAQERVGEFGKVFTIYKFRSMRTDSEKTGPQLASKVDPRVTRFGNFIRKTRLDELPQLWNVLKGDMSLVGPRPERPYFVVKLQREIPFFRQRLFVKPGVTGLAQVKFRYAETADDSLQKLQYDLAYIKNMGILYDIQIILETIKVMVFRRGAH